MPRDFMVKESMLDDYQMDLLDRTLDRSLVVSGCAGSGKSVIALQKAKRIQAERAGLHGHRFHESSEGLYASWQTGIRPK